MKHNSSPKSVINYLLLSALLLAGNANAQEKGADYYYKNLPFKMNKVVEPSFPGKVFQISDYGAVADGQSLNTMAFNKAIKACTEEGGGRVNVPSGIWLTGPIELKSNVDLHVERGGLILFTKDHTQYPMIRSSSNSNSFTTASPIYGYDLKNIAISGEGIIDGAGDTWRPVKKIKTTAAQWKTFTSTGVISKDGSVWWPTKEAMNGDEYLKSLKTNGSKMTAEDILPARDYLRPHMVFLVNCENVLLQDITLRNSPKFVFCPNHCTDLTMKSVIIFNEWWAQNGDGIDISACKNVLIYKCTVSAGDDGICMKSSGKSDATSAALENVIVAACNVYHAHGGFVIGSNTDGGMRNIYVADCNFIGTDIGIRVKSNAGRGGLVRDIFINNIAMSDIVNEAVLFDTYYEDVPAGTTKPNNEGKPRDKIPVFKDFHLSNIFCNGAKTAISITGLPDMPVSNIFFDNMVISSQQGFVSKEAADISLENVKLITEKEPVYSIIHTSKLKVNNGFMPVQFRTFIEADKQSGNINVTSTDMHGKTNTSKILED